MILSLLGLAIIGLAQCDPINFHAEITCEQADGTIFMGTWCGELIVYEEDSHPNHDLLFWKIFYVNDNRKKTLDYESWPGGDYSLHYEFKYTLSHNCTSDGLERCITPKESQDVRFWGERNVTFNIAAHDNGVMGACYDPNMNEEDTRKMKDSRN